MNEMKPISNFKNNLYKVAIILLLAYAAFSSAMKDLDRLQEVAGDVQAVTADGIGSLARVYSATRTLAEGAELARAPQASSPIGSPRIDIIAAGGSVTLAGFEHDVTSARSNEHLFAQKKHGAVSCPVRQRGVPKTIEKDLKWDVVAQLQKRDELLVRELPIRVDTELSRLGRRDPRLRAIISKLPLTPGKTKWSNVDEFKSFNRVVDFAFKAARAEDADIEPKADRLETNETNEDASRYLIEFKHGVTGTDRDELEMHQ